MNQILKNRKIKVESMEDMALLQLALLEEGFAWQFSGSNYLYLGSSYDYSSCKYLFTSCRYIAINLFTENGKESFSNDPRKELKYKIENNKVIWIDEEEDEELDYFIIKKHYFKLSPIQKREALHILTIDMLKDIYKAEETKDD